MISKLPILVAIIVKGRNLQKPKDYFKVHLANAFLISLYRNRTAENEYVGNISNFTVTNPLLVQIINNIILISTKDFLASVEL